MDEVKQNHIHAIEEEEEDEKTKMQMQMQIQTQKEKEREVEEWKKKFRALDKENHLLKNAIGALKEQMKEMEKQIVAKQEKSSSLSEQNDAEIATAIRKRKRQSVTAGAVTPKKLTQVPSLPMLSWDWIPIENEYVMGTLWKSIGATSVADTETVKIPQDFELLFRNPGMENEIEDAVNIKDTNEQEEGLLSNISVWREKHVREVLKQIPATPAQIRMCILDADDGKLGRDIIDKLLTIVPQTEEVKYVFHKVSALGVKISQLTDVEQFFYRLADIDLLEPKLRLWQCKHKFEDSLDEKYNELLILKNALMAIDKSENLRKILQIVLAFGNFLHAGVSRRSDNKAQYGVYGFHLESLKTLKTVKSHDKQSLTLLTYIYSYCKTNFPHALKVIDDLKTCHEATKLKGSVVYKNVMLAHEELIVFQRQLRKYRELKNKKNEEEKDGNKKTMNTNTNNKFEATMSSFNRRARESCRILLDIWNECSEVATRVAQEYDYEFTQNDSFEQLIQVFDDFMSDLKKARIDWETSQNQKEIQS
ncbi:hypothetical protein RFI_09229 [Reticulomyxa filosa]|uniref:FH2 domain-containing protein n=1 Tax=Reticulomyxa filosa TaxID=46433 RepID=X6NQE5_RETFI|nr:hypothetical protein RFI_09229 [Reticulomyxa filosa]|eukprot:ETO27904.1 hypothetical protein RFI_09229 [Reticulomyxa filosa]